MKKEAVLLTAMIAVIMAMIGCALETADQSPDEVADQDIGVTQQALTWQGELIEQDNGGLFHAFPYMYTLDNPTSNVCGWTGTPDYILHFNRPGAYANRAKLRLDGETIAARCMIKNPSSARVYDNDHVMVCVGNGYVALCPGGVSSFSGIGLWEKP